MTPPNTTVAREVTVGMAEFVDAEQGGLGAGQAFARARWKDSASGIVKQRGVVTKLASAGSKSKQTRCSFASVRTMLSYFGALVLWECVRWYLAGASVLIYVLLVLAGVAFWYKAGKFFTTLIARGSYHALPPSEEDTVDLEASTTTPSP